MTINNLSKITLSADDDDFTDLFYPLDEPERGDSYPGPIPLKGRALEYAHKIANHSHTIKHNDFPFRDERCYFRVHRSDTVNETFLIARRIPINSWNLADCGISSAYRKIILSPRLKAGGLVIVCGEPGHGKTTTCVALIKERLLRFGGVTATIEDPVEFLIQGKIGDGMCIQKEVSGIDGFGPAIRDTLRSYPSKTHTSLFIGEVRDTDTATLALKAAVDGRLTILSVHAADVVAAVHRLISLASYQLGEEQARMLLAAGIRLVIHQRLTTTNLKRSGYSSTSVSHQVLLDTDDVAGIIRQKSVPLEQLKTSLAQQNAQIANDKPIQLRKL